MGEMIHISDTGLYNSVISDTIEMCKKFGHFTKEQILFRYYEYSCTRFCIDVFNSFGVELLGHVATVQLFKLQNVFHNSCPILNSH